MTVELLDLISILVSGVGIALALTTFGMAIYHSRRSQEDAEQLKARAERELALIASRSAAQRTKPGEGVKDASEIGTTSAEAVKRAEEMADACIRAYAQQLSKGHIGGPAIDEQTLLLATEILRERFSLRSKGKNA